MAKLYVSDQLDFLVKVLARNLSDPYPSLSPRTIVVPHLYMKNWLLLQLSSHLKVCMGWKVLSLKEVLKPKGYPTSVELIGAIYQGLKGSEDPVLTSYLLGNEKKTVDLAHHLSFLFESYGKFGVEFKEHGWQSQLYQNLLDSYPLKPECHIEGPIHCFGCDFISELQWKAFPLDALWIYLFSPSVHFWEDVCTPKEKKWLLKKVPKLEPYLSEAPSLLSQWGKLGRETLKLLDSFSLEIFEQYRETPPQCALQVLQSNLLHWTQENLPDDDSIRIFKAGSSCFREVEILRENIETLARKNVQFSEMTVLAVDIEMYAPFIELIFSKDIPYRMTDIHRPSPFLQALHTFLDSTEENLASLFEERGFYQKHNEEIIQVCQALQKDLPVGEKTLNEWALYLEDMAKKYFLIDEAGGAVFSQWLENLRRAKTQGKFPASIIQKHLPRRCPYNEFTSSLHAVSFANLQMGCVTAAKAIFLLGMNEDYWPRKEGMSSLNVLKPPLTSPEIDRYLLLQILFAAQEYLYISYPHFSAQEGKPLDIASPLQELVSQIPGEWIQNYPPLKRVLNQRTLPDYFKLSLPFEPLPSGVVTLQISDLQKLARHPWEFYLQKTLRISIAKEPLDSFAVQKSWFSREHLQNTWSEKLKQELPPGRLGKVQLQEIETLSHRVNKQLKEWNLTLSCWSLLESCREKTLISSHDIEAPCLQIAVTDSLKVKIVGKLQRVSEQGLVITTDDLLKTWPECLTAAIASGNHAMVCMKKGKIIPLVDPQESLRLFLIYYFRALSHPSPLISPWADFFLNDGKKQEGYFEDPIVDWVLMRTQVPQDNELKEKWKELKEIFAHAAF